MGQLFAKDDFTSNYKGGMNTEDFSSTIPYMKNLVLFNESDNYDMYKLFEKSPQNNNNNNNFSETSPFISSDVYNQLLNNLKNKQSGGGKKRGSKRSSRRSKVTETETVSATATDTNEPYRTEDRDDDFEEESSTSSSSSEVDIFKSDKQKKSKKKTLQQALQKSEDEHVNLDPDEEDITEMSAGSYLSSSAKSDDSDASLSVNSTVSVRKSHKSRQAYSDSVNTSDINIISIED